MRLWTGLLACLLMCPTRGETAVPRLTWRAIPAQHREKAGNHRRRAHDKRYGQMPGTAAMHDAQLILIALLIRMRRRPVTHCGSVKKPRPWRPVRCNTAEPIFARRPPVDDTTLRIQFSQDLFTVFCARKA
jgi:hypothetical protein